MHPLFDVICLALWVGLNPKDFLKTVAVLAFVAVFIWSLT